MSINIEDVLGQPAIFQILNKKRGRTEEEKRVLALKIEASCKRFNNNQGRLSVDEFYNVIKLQNGVEVSKDELRRLVADLEMDKHFKVSIKVIFQLHFYKKKRRSKTAIKIDSNDKQSLVGLRFFAIFFFFCTNRSQKIFVHHFFLSLQDFMKEPIISQDVFLAIDKNKDG